MKPQNDANQIYAALDVGSDKVLCILGQAGREPGTLRVTGIGNARSAGIRHGSVVDVELAVQSIRNAVNEALYTAENAQVAGFWAAIGGQSLKSANCVGQTVPRNGDGVVTREDVEIARNNAFRAAAQAAQGGEIIKLLPQGFRCGDVFTDQPEGLVGPKLEAYTHALYGSAVNAQNLRRCIQRVDVINLLGYMPHPCAAARAALTETERVCGAAVIDIGAETTSLIVYSEDRIQFTDVRPWGAEYFTRDLAMVLGISLEEAEQLKLKSGECRLSQVIPDEVVQYELRRGALSRLYSRELIVRTLSARVNEFFELYRKHLEDARALEHVEIVVLTGGGAMLPGIAEEAERILGRRVRVGRPLRTEGESPLLQRPDSVVAVGLLHCALSPSARDGETPRPAPVRQGLLGQIKSLFVGDY